MKRHDHELKRLIHLATSAVEIVGTAIIIVGAFGPLAFFLIGMAKGATSREMLVADFRSGLGRSILLGLKFLIGTFLSFSLEIEIDGRWPSQKRQSALEAPYDRPRISHSDRPPHLPLSTIRQF